tara:strand:+ start:6195 stop:6611 length:417 start_codon:yes stop_codon:yes gene_type:complete
MNKSNELNSFRIWNEKDLFDWLVINHYKDLVKANSPISRWDCYSPEQYHRIELKCRKTHYDSLLIERKKYDAIIKKCDDNLDIPIYINSTPNGIYRFNLYNLNFNWEKKRLRRTTEFEDNSWTEKEIALIEVIDAEVL